MIIILKDMNVDFAHCGLQMAGAQVDLCFYLPCREQYVKIRSWHHFIAIHYHRLSKYCIKCCTLWSEVSSSTSFSTTYIVQQIILDFLIACSAEHLTNFSSHSSVNQALDCYIAAPWNCPFCYQLNYAICIYIARTLGWILIVQFPISGKELVHEWLNCAPLEGFKLTASWAKYSSCYISTIS